MAVCRTFAWDRQRTFCGYDGQIAVPARESMPRNL
jgi:hypothetical protein